MERPSSVKSFSFQWMLPDTAWKEVNGCRDLKWDGARPLWFHHFFFFILSHPNEWSCVICIVISPFHYFLAQRGMWIVSELKMEKKKNSITDFLFQIGCKPLSRHDKPRYTYIPIGSIKTTYRVLVLYMFLYLLRWVIWDLTFPFVV